MRQLWRISHYLVAAAVTAAITGCVSGQTYDPSVYPQYPQYVQYPEGTPPVTPMVPAGQVALSPDQLDQLLGPIALYPDPLLSLIFPAATYPQDVASAEQWLQSTPNPTEAAITAQPWDDSIKGLVHYPTVLKMMSDQMDWTNALGAAFLNQQQDVMASVQRLRAAAQAAQNLQTTQQEQVLADGGAIRIEPVDPSVIYVPQYDPLLVYSNPCPINFGVGFPLGLWCNDDFDWGGGLVIVGGGWFSHWHHPDDWDRVHPGWDHRPPNWRPDPHTWTRAPLRPAPRLTPTVVTRVGLDHPRVSPARRPGVAPARPVAPAARIGNAPAATPSKNVFSQPQSRAEVDRARARVQPAKPAVTAPPARAPEPARPPIPVKPAPPRVVAPPPRAAAPPVRVAAPPVQRAPQPAPRMVSPPPQNVFHGGSSGGQTRVESSRGQSSTHR